MGSHNTQRNISAKMSAKPTAPKPVKAPSPAAIRRAVASSTAIATGQPIARIERALRAARRGEGRFSHLKLAR